MFVMTVIRYNREIRALTCHLGIKIKQYLVRYERELIKTVCFNRVIVQYSLIFNTFIVLTFLIRLVFSIYKRLPDIRWNLL